MKAAGQEMPIEVEAQSLEQVDQALDRRRRTSSCSTTCRPGTSEKPCGASPARAKTEISGGVSLERLPELAATGADYVSIGALTHSAPSVDLSFELEPDA